MGKHYDIEYKDYVSKIIVEEGRVIKEVSYELEIPYGTLRRWVKAYRDKHKSGDLKEELVVPSDHKKVLNDKDKEIAKLKEENEILKKARHIFTQNQE